MWCVSGCTCARRELRVIKTIKKKCKDKTQTKQHIALGELSKQNSTFCFKNMKPDSSGYMCCMLFGCLVYGIQCDNGTAQQSQCVKVGQQRAIHLRFPGHYTQNYSSAANSIKQMKTWQIKQSNKALKQVWNVTNLGSQFKEKHQ